MVNNRSLQTNNNRFRPKASIDGLVLTVRPHSIIVPNINKPWAVMTLRRTEKDCPLHCSRLKSRLQFPSSYLGKGVEDLAQYIDMLISRDAKVVRTGTGRGVRGFLSRSFGEEDQVDMRACGERWGSGCPFDVFRLCVSTKFVMFLHES
jgi:hypothetical protein